MIAGLHWTPDPTVPGNLWKSTFKGHPLEVKRLPATKDQDHGWGGWCNGVLIAVDAYLTPMQAMEIVGKKVQGVV